MSHKRINISIEPTLLRRLDEDAKRLGVSRSVYLEQAVEDFMTYKEGLVKPRQQGEMLSRHQLLYTRRGRRHLRDWCNRTVFAADAKEWMEDLEKATKIKGDDEISEE